MTAPESRPTEWKQLTIVGVHEDSFLLAPAEEDADEDEDAMGQLFTSLVSLRRPSKDNLLVQGEPHDLGGASITTQRLTADVILEKEHSLCDQGATRLGRDCILDPEQLVKKYVVPEQDLLGFGAKDLEEIARDFASAERVLEQEDVAELYEDAEDGNKVSKRLELDPSSNIGISFRYARKRRE